MKPTRRKPSTEVAAQGTKPAVAGWEASEGSDTREHRSEEVREGGLGSSSRDFSRRLGPPVVAVGLTLLALAGPSPLRADEGTPWWQKLRWTWVTAGLTAGSATAALFASVHANELEDRYRSALDASRTEPQPAATVLALGGRAKGQAELANVLWGVAGIGVITGSILAWLELTAPDAPSRVYVAPAPTADGPGFAVGGRFP